MDIPGYRGNLTWLPERTLYLTRHGSHAYGTNVADSDMDIRGVCIAPKEYYLGYSKVFENYTQDEPDLVVFELRKFLHLASEANPNVLELLFTDPSDHLGMHPMVRPIFENRDLFLSQRVRHTYSGFAVAQIKKIQKHARWLQTPPTPPTREAFSLEGAPLLPREQLGAALALLGRKVESWTHFDYLESGDIQTLRRDVLRSMEEMLHWGEQGPWLAAGKSLGYDSNFLEYLAREKAFRSREKEYSDYLVYKKGRNPKRAAIEAKYGYDCKYALHAVRLQRTAKEILTEGKLLVKRPDAEELVSIRNGAWSLERVIGYTRDMDSELQELAAKSGLPKAPKLKEIEALCVMLVEKSLGSLLPG